MKDKVSNLEEMEEEERESLFIYYESIKRELNKRLILECRCDPRLKDTSEETSFFFYTD